MACTFYDFIYLTSEPCMHDNLVCLGVFNAVKSASYLNDLCFRLNELNCLTEYISVIFYIE